MESKTIESWLAQQNPDGKDQQTGTYGAVGGTFDLTTQDSLVVVRAIGAALTEYRSHQEGEPEARSTPGAESASASS